MSEHEFAVHGYRVRIVHDDGAESPREWGGLGRMLCWHRRARLGDETVSVDEAEECVRTTTAEGGVWLPLYLYEHGGMTMATAPFGCRWDSGQVGVIIADTAAIREQFGLPESAPITDEIREGARAALEAEVEVYDQWLRGDVWGFVIEDAEGNFVDSCYGFFGAKSAEEEARGVAESLPYQLELDLEVSR